MKKRIFFVAASGLWVLATLFNQPPRDLRSSGSPEPILSGAIPDGQAIPLLERSCQNCHSSNVKWPFYSRLYPVSVMISRDVREARSHMDLSLWATYPDSEKIRLLQEIGSVVRTGFMPPRKYTLMHPEAVLKEAERDEIYRWTRLNRKALAQQQ